MGRGVSEVRSGEQTSLRKLSQQISKHPIHNKKTHSIFNSPSNFFKLQQLQRLLQLHYFNNFSNFSNSSFFNFNFVFGKAILRTPKTCPCPNPSTSLRTFNFLAVLRASGFISFLQLLLFFSIFLFATSTFLVFSSFLLLSHVWRDNPSS